MILVAGGTGRLGTALVRRLRARGLAVRVLTRDPARAAHLAACGPEVAIGDLRDADSLHRAVQGVDTVVAAAHGFGARDVSPDTVDRIGNHNLVDAAVRGRASVVLVSGVGVAADSPLELFRAKHDAEQVLRRSGVPWTIVRATAFVETWVTIMGEPLRAGGRALVFGRGENPVNFVPVSDVAALLERAVMDPSLRGETLQIGGAENVTCNELAARIQRIVGCPGKVRHVPRPVLRAMGMLLRGLDPMLARQARAALAMDTTDMTFDASATCRRFPDLSGTSLEAALHGCLTGRGSAPP